MNNENKFLNLIAMTFVTVLLSAFILTYMGIIDLKIINEIHFSPWTEYFANFAMFMINMFFVFTVSFCVLDKRIWYILAGYGIIYIIFSFTPWGHTLFFSTLLPIFYVVIVAKLKFNNEFNKILIRHGLFMLVVPIYQQISGYIKFMNMGLQYYKCNPLMLFVYSIDLYLFYSLIYMEVNNYARRSGKHLVCTEAVSISVNIEPDEQAFQQQIASVSPAQRFVFNALCQFFQIFQLAIVLLIGLINNMCIELLIMLAVFFLGRRMLGTSWHSKKLSVCSAVTFGGFYILTKLTLPLNISLFSCIALSAGFVYILHHAGLHEIKYNALLMDKQQKEAFNLKTSTEPQMRERCRELGKSKEYEDFCVMAFVWKLRRKDIALKMQYEESTVKRYITKYRHELEGDKTA